MSTPKNPGPKLPDKPVRPPTVAQEAPAAAPSSDTASVLERLKAAQPRTAAASGDDGPSTSPAATAATGTASAGGTTGGGATRTLDVPSGATITRAAGGRATPGGSTRTLDAPSGATTPRAAGGKEAPGTGSDAGGPDAAERLRVAAVRARAAANVTGRVIHRGSSATARHVSSWDRDIVRQVVVTVCAIACILGSAAGVEAFGGPSIRDAAGGLFAPDATLLAPSSTAFSIWSVIYVGLVAYTVFQWLPSQRRTDRQRHLGWTVAASMLLNLAWILSAQADRLTLSLVVIMLLFFALLSAVRTMNDHPNETRLEGALVDTPIGLYLGWVLLAAAANWAAFLTAAGADLFGWSGVAWSILGISAVLVTAAIICSTDRGRLAVAAATSWGLLWIAVERVFGQPFAMNLAFFAVLAIFLLLITAGSRRHRVDHEYRHWLRAQQDARREPVHLGGGDYEDSRY
ncbi:TspO/MBR family protein [Arthrobacter antioxidans]|uniref:TspO/MBR family protein n=1 Tax=Arthrobacter antioxidans TaxID=2895818 RepID=UPI001FFF7411|nr:TspO/MBR family protein [Arthrobacter antioxidans]